MRGVAMEGLEWGAAERVPTGSRRFSLHIVATILDGLVPIEEVLGRIRSALPKHAQSVSIAPPEPYVSAIYLSDPDLVRRVCELPITSSPRVFLSAEGAFLHGPIVQVREDIYCVCRPPVPASLSVLRSTGLHSQRIETVQ